MRQLLNKPEVRADVGELNLSYSNIVSVPLAWLVVTGLLLSPVDIGFLWLGLACLITLFFLNFFYSFIFYKSTWMAFRF